LGVRAIQESSPDFLKQQLDAVFEDIFPDAIKIGMVSSSELICVIAERLQFYSAKNIVVDPVMIATSGSSLMKTDAIQTLIDKLFPLATIITPNIPESEVLSGIKISTHADMERAAKEMVNRFGCAVLCKGGHNINDANDFLCTPSDAMWIQGVRINNPNTHGTGCTLSRAIAANLAKDFSLYESVVKAKAYISGALAAMLDLGNGSGPLNHAFVLANK
jgi:hydroxymethylpyrimidine/phosphomethylpyrimidine kinase